LGIYIYIYMKFEYIKKLGTGYSGSVYLVKNYKKIDICNLIDNIENYWFSSNKKKYIIEIKNDIKFMKYNSDNIKKIINYYQNKI
jgi:hypothetical protein